MKPNKESSLVHEGVVPRDPESESTPHDGSEVANATDVNLTPQQQEEGRESARPGVVRVYYSQRAGYNDDTTDEEGDDDDDSLPPTPAVERTTTPHVHAQLVDETADQQQINALQQRVDELESHNAILSSSLTRPSGSSEQETIEPVRIVLVEDDEEEEESGKVKEGELSKYCSNNHRRAFFAMLIAAGVLVAVAVTVGITVPSDPKSPQETKRFFTTLNYTHNYYGHMFDMTAKKDIKVVGLQIHLDSGQTESIGKSFTS